MTFTAIDFEGFYSNDISVTTMGAWHYARATDIYMVTVASDDGFRFVGHPKDCPWDRIKDHTAIFANASFDLTLLEWLQESGVVPQFKFPECLDVLDLSRYLGFPGSLAGASEALLGVPMSKTTRGNMKNKRWNEMSEEFKQEVRDYALKDAEMTLRLWLEHGHKWPWHERELSRQTREIGMRGVPVDVEAATKAKKHLEGLIWESESKIPWAKEVDAKILSPLRLAEECRRVGITPPSSLAQDSEECSRWEDTYGEQYPWVGAMRDWRRCNILLKKVEVLLRRTRPDGVFPFSLRYFGSGITGRFSGESGFSMLNLPRGEMYGVDLRGLFKAPPGFKFLILDFSSLEPRVGNWLVGNWDMLELMKSPDADIYEAHARATMGYTDPRPLKQYDKEMGTEIRKLAKARVLGAGYGASGEKFVFIAKVMADLDLNIQQANQVIQDFRRENKKFVDTWKRLDHAMKMRAGKGDFSIELPSGRELVYRDVSNVGDGLSAVTCRSGKNMRTRWWGSKNFENSCQGAAREVLCEKLLQLELEHKIPVCLHVHDEIVALVPEDEAEEKFKTMKEVMEAEPSFMPGLPLAAEGAITDRYGK